MQLNALVFLLDLDALEKVTASKKAKNKEQISFYKQRLGLEFKNLKGGKVLVLFKLGNEYKFKLLFTCSTIFLCPLCGL